MSRENEAVAELATLSLAALRIRWRGLYGRDAPQSSADLLARAIAWGLQEKRHGGLDPGVQRELERLAHDPGPDGRGSEQRLRPGTRLIRDWGDRCHVVLVRDDSYVFEDRHYASLSQIASDITGAHWSGPRFFGLKAKARKTAKLGATHGAA